MLRVFGMARYPFLYRRKIMANPLKGQQRLYEKLADKSMKAQHRQICILYTAIGFMTAWLVTAIILSNSGNYGSFPAWRFVALVVGAILGFGVGLLLVARGKNLAGELARLEQSEGYSDATLDEAYRRMNKNQSNAWRTTNAIIAGMMHNFRGEFSKTLELFSTIDESIFRVNSANAHNYYASLLMAYLLTGDLDHASDAYNRGNYFLRTYMSSPVSGVYVSQVLAVYELYAGHYDVSLQFLDNAIRAGSADIRPEQRIPNENMSSIIYYWKAVNFATIGDKASAWEMVNYCRDFYKTPYYDSLFKKLLDDMEKDEKNKKSSEMITDAETLS